MDAGVNSKEEINSKIERLDRQIKRLKQKKTWGEVEEIILEKKILEKTNLENRLVEMQRIIMIE